MNETPRIEPARFFVSSLIKRLLTFDKSVTTVEIMGAHTGVAMVFLAPRAAEELNFCFTVYFMQIN